MSEGRNWLTNKKNSSKFHKFYFEILYSGQSRLSSHENFPEKLTETSEGIVFYEDTDIVDDESVYDWKIMAWNINIHINLISFRLYVNDNNTYFLL